MSNEETGELPVSIPDLVAAVGTLRVLFGKADAELRERRAQFDADNADLIAQHAQLKAQLDENEQALRTAAVNSFNETNSRRPHDAVSIRLIKRLEYDPVRAAEWARVNAPALLVLDTRKFEKAAPNLPGAPVQEVEVPQAAISSNLAPYMAPLGLEDE